MAKTILEVAVESFSFQSHVNASNQSRRLSFPCKHHSVVKGASFLDYGQINDPARVVLLLENLNVNSHHLYLLLTVHLPLV